MKKGLLSILIVTSLSVLSVEPVTPIDSNEELEKIERASFLTETSRKHFEEELIKTNQFTLLYTYMESNFAQHGKGQIYDTKGGVGKGIYSSYSKILSDNNKLIFTGWYQMATFLEPGNIGGREVEVKRFAGSGLYSIQFTRPRFIYNIDLGMTYLNQNPEKFTSKEKLLPSYYSLGPTLGLGLNFLLTDVSKLKTQLLFNMPALLKEQGAKTGYHDLSYYYNASLLYERDLNKTLRFYLGFMLESRMHKFEGSGERGVTNAKMTSYSLVIPVGFGHEF